MFYSIMDCFIFKCHMADGRTIDQWNMCVCVCVCVCVCMYVFIYLCMYVHMHEKRVNNSEMQQ